MINRTALRIGMIGIGGIGNVHLETIRTLHYAGCVQLTAIADPTASRFPDTLSSFAWERVAVYDDYKDLIARSDIDAVIVSTPIHLHAQQTVDSLAAGKHVYLEKPPCATIDEYHRLEAAWRASGKVCAVGFQMQAAPVYTFVKDVVESGRVGEIEQIWAAARWPRSDAYYGRSSWAGRMQIHGAPVFDGPATNALGHVVHAAAVIAGDLARVRGSLKRARPIESYDTAYLEADADSGANLRLMLTHATSKNLGPTMHIRGTKGTVEFDWNMNARFRTRDGNVAGYAFPHQSMMTVMLDFIDAIHTEDHTATDLPDTLGFLQIVNGALASCGDVSSFASNIVSKVNEGTPEQVYSVAGLDDEIDTFMADPSRTPSLVAPGSWLSIDELMVRSCVLPTEDLRYLTAK